MIEPSDINEDIVIKSVKVLAKTLEDYKYYRRLTRAFVKTFDVDVVKPCNHGYTPKQFNSMNPVSKISIESSCELCNGTGFIITLKEKGKK